jgi:hypothetical protein
MRITANILFALGALVVLDGLATRFLGASFLVRPLLGQDILGIYVVGAGIGVLLICAVFKTIVDTQDAKKPKS